MSVDSASVPVPVNKISKLGTLNVPPANLTFILVSKCCRFAPADVFCTCVEPCAKILPKLPLSLLLPSTPCCETGIDAPNDGMSIVVETSHILRSKTLGCARQSSGASAVAHSPDQINVLSTDGQGLNFILYLRTFSPRHCLSPTVPLPLLIPEIVVVHVYGHSVNGRRVIWPVTSSLRADVAAVDPDRSPLIIDFCADDIHSCGCCQRRRAIYAIQCHVVS